MPGPEQEKRAAAVGRMRFLRGGLEVHEARHPEPGTLTFWSDAIRFNEALRDVADEVGDDWYRVLHIDEGSMITTPKSWPRREQRPPAVGRHIVLGKVRETLRLLGEE